MEKSKILKKIYEAKLPSNAKSIMFYFVNRANGEGTCFPSVSTIAEECGMSERTVQRMIKILVKENLIFKKSRFYEKGGQTSNLYYINLEDQPEMKEASETGKAAEVKDTEMSEVEIVPEEERAKEVVERSSRKPWNQADYYAGMGIELINFEFYHTDQSRKKRMNVMPRSRIGETSDGETELLCHSGGVNLCTP